MPVAITEYLNPRIAKPVAIVLLLIITVVMMVQLYQRGNANAWYYQVEYALNDWSAAGAIPNEQAYRDTVAVIDKIVALDPNHPHYAHMKGRVLHWGVNEGFESLAKLADVKEWYVKATELRPTWPDPWADLAILNHYIEGNTPETQFNLAQAQAAGPYIALVMDAERALKE